jgi:hypothetical protein
MKTWNPDDSRWKTKWEESRSITKHGTHDQKTHGRKGGGGASGGETYNTKKPLTTKEMIELSTSQSPEYGFDTVSTYVNDPQGVNVKLRADREMAEMEFRSGNLIAGLDETMVRTPNITRSITVYRGLDADSVEGFDNLEPGDIFSDAGFVSTSLDSQIAVTFADRFMKPDGVVLEINVPANTEGIFPNSWLSDTSNTFFNEFEFLLPRDAQFKVISTEGKVWKLEVTNG